MFENFPDNQRTSLGFMLALRCGGAISEVDDACRSTCATPAERMTSTVEAFA